MLFIDTQSGLEKQLSTLLNLKYFGFDTETTGLCPHVNKLQMVQIGTMEEQWVIDARKVNIQPLKPLFENERIPKYGANLAFDYKFLKKQGIEVENNVDVMLADRILYSGIYSYKQAGNYTLETIADRHCGIKMNKDIRDSFLIHKGDFSHEQIEYAANDVLVPLKVYKQQHRLLLDAGLMLTAKLEWECVPVFGDIEYYGMYLNREKWQELIEHNIMEYQKFRQQTKDLLRPIWDLNLLGEVNIQLASKDQMLWAVRKLGYDVPDTKEETLQKMLPKEHYEPIVKFREYETILNRYGENWFDAINPVTGRVHTGLFQVGAETGRPASRNPNLLNVKRDNKYRNCFEAEDGMIASVDFEGQELRIMTEITREPAWVKAFAQGLNVHKIVGKQMFRCEVGKSEELVEVEGVKVKQVDLYNITKNLNFGCLPDEAKILTKDGWKHHWEVKHGIDETLSYKDDKLKWSTIKEVCVYEDAPLQQIKKSKRAFDVLATPNHRWMKRRRTGRGKTRRYVYECNDHLTSECKLIVSRESEGGSLNLTWEEGYIIGYLFTDGSINRGKFVNAPSQAKGKRVKFEGIIHQKKPHERLYNVIKPHIVSSYKQKNGTMSYWLNPDYLRDLFKKANLHDELNEEFVLSLNKLARNGFCHGGLEAEGHKRGDSYAFTQNKGTTLDSFKLAFFLEGFYVTEHDNPHPDPKHNGKSKRLHLTRNEIGLQHTKPELIPGKHKVWCPVTENGTWVANYKGQYFLTGNTAYGAGPMKLMALFHKVGVPCTLERAKEILEEYKENYPVLNDTLDGIAEQTVEDGFSTSLGGRKRYFNVPVLDGFVGREAYKEHMRRIGAVMREGRNHAIQGTGADELKRSLAILRKNIKARQKQNELFIVLCPYDEIDAETKKNHEDNLQIVEEAMLLGQEYYQTAVSAAVEGELAPFWKK
jgi:DNA polymerase I-like protein with 3'-5' exonuclease and polymerase domains